MKSFILPVGHLMTAISGTPSNNEIVVVHRMGTVDHYVIKPYTATHIEDMNMLDFEARFAALEHFSKSLKPSVVCH